jgi:predicted DNA-binding antitoxin AbrB/MazE fold protein
MKDGPGGGDNVINVPAIYENGVLRLTEPVSLREGQRVRVSVEPVPDLPGIRPPTPEEEDYARRLLAAKSLEEMHAIMETAPPSPDFDIQEMINESRRLTGFRMPDPEPAAGEGG